MKVKLTLFLFLAIVLFNFQAEAYFFKNLICAQVNTPTNPTQFNISSFLMSANSQNEINFLFSTSAGEIKKENVLECIEETLPEPIVYCEDEDFGLVISSDTEPYQVAINPFKHNNVEFGPFYFLCKEQ